MTVLAKKELVRRIRDEKVLRRRLWITPLLDDNQIGDASLDVRLGNEFILIRQSNLLSIDPAHGERMGINIGKYQERFRVCFGEKFILHPNQFILGSTLEYIGLPLDLTAQVEGRSSWGRLGLIIATATPVAPGFRGVITFELINAGQAPIVLYPGLSIAQLIVSETSDEIAYRGRYHYPTGPEFSMIFKDEDMQQWGRKSLFS